MICSVAKHLVISVVSHKQAHLVAELLSDIAAFCNPSTMMVLVTINIEETIPFKETEFPFELVIIRNPSPKGFGANHNAAFSKIKCDFFCVLNPDIRLTIDPFSPLLAELEKANTGLVAPLIVDPFGKVEDSARRAITPLSIARRILKLDKGTDYILNGLPISPDWVAGMFMLFRSHAFSDVKGFDEGFYMYCEDADLCIRLSQVGYRISLIPTIAVIHNAQRSSHTTLMHLKWHISSLLKFFIQQWF